MTIDEIKSVSIVQFLETEGYQYAYIHRGNYWYLSPFRAESSPSFNVSPTKNLWNDFGASSGGNIINLVQKMHPSWNNHQVLTYLEQQIKNHNLKYAEDYEAMKSNQILNITYHSYWKDEENNFDVEPFCVKIFRQRWYLVARSTYTYYHKQGPRIYCLDRITYLQKREETFKMPEGWSAEEFFDGCFGIIADNNIPKEHVKLKVSAGQANYLRDLKLHESQEETECNEEYSIFTYYLRPTFDFQQELLWNGEDLEVLAPTWLRKELAEKIKRMYNKYNISE